MENVAQSHAFRPRAFTVPPGLAPQDLACALHGLAPQVRRPVLLEGCAGQPRRFSLLAFDPLPGSDPATVREAGVRAAALAPSDGDPIPGFFHGGFLGALSYEGGAREGCGLSLPDDPLGLPGLAGALYVDFLVQDHARGETTLVLGESPGDDRPAVAERKERVFQALATRPSRSPVQPLAPPVRHVAEAEHKRRIEAARRWIAAGEIYQANVTQRFSREMRGDPVELYLRLRELHPAPYQSFLRFDEGAILSASPELLLEFQPGRTGRVRTRPIKGTIGRGRDEEEDQRRIAALRASEKDRAELGMIVDLERNDLGRIARPASVEVGAFPSLETYATVHHLAADVTCRPALHCDAATALLAVFPGGSITGAPKLRSMELIAEIEAEGRGFSYGSIFMIDTRGHALANLLIRTLIWCPRPETPGPELPGPEHMGTIHYRVGGGITYRSDAGLEEEECRLKGLALAEALNPAGG